MLSLLSQRCQLWYYSPMLQLAGVYVPREPPLPDSLFQTLYKFPSLCGTLVPPEDLASFSKFLTFTSIDSINI